MPKGTKTLGNNKARAWESLGFEHKKRGCARFDTPSYIFICLEIFGLQIITRIPVNLNFIAFILQPQLLLQTVLQQILPCEV